MLYGGGQQSCSNQMPLGFNLMVGAAGLKQLVIKESQVLISIIKLPIGLACAPPRPHNADHTFKTLITSTSNSLQQLAASRRKHWKAANQWRLQTSSGVRA